MPTTDSSVQEAVAAAPPVDAELEASVAEPAVATGADRAPLLDLRSYGAAVRAFETPLGTPAAFPDEIDRIIRRIAAWSRHGRTALRRLQSPPVFRQVYGFGSVVFETHRLLRVVNTKHIDDWMNAPSTGAEARAAFESWRRAFGERYDAIRALSAEILLSSNLSMFDDDPLAMLIRNIRKLADVLARRSYLWGSLGVTLGIAALALRERRFLVRLVGHELAATGITLNRIRDARRVRHVNRLAGQSLVTERHAKQLRGAYRLLSRHRVAGPQADAIVLEALRQGDRAASKPWKGLVKLRQLVEYSGVDPRGSDFLDVFRDLTDAPVQYTHTPGLEWVVRDYELGRKLLQMDGRIPEGSATARLQQGRVSVMPGISKAAPGATEFARKYFGPVASFLNSMVTADGADHQRLRKPFMKFFSRRAVFDQAELVQATVSALLDRAAVVARKNEGRFDFKTDFAFQFPIRVICGIVGIRGADIEKVQRWTEESTRSMDTEAGVSSITARRGQSSAVEQKAFFGRLLAEARTGQPASELVRALALDDTLSEAERIANLSVIVFAGFETTTGLLCLGVRELLRHPEQWAHLRESLVAGPEIQVGGQAVSDVELRWYVWAASEPREADPARRDRTAGLLAQSDALQGRLEAVRRQESALDAAIEEMLRWTAPGSIIPLTASQDVELPVPRAMLVRGRHLGPGDMLRIARGETVVVSVDEINRCCPMGAGKFDIRAEGSFDITRDENTKHLSFGVKHLCIGATLARENAKRALEGLLRRFPDLQCDGPAIPQDMELFHGLARFPVRSPSAACALSRPSVKAGTRYALP